MKENSLHLKVFAFVSACSFEKYTTFTHAFIQMHRSYMTAETSATRKTNVGRKINWSVEATKAATKNIRFIQVLIGLMLV